MSETSANLSNQAVNFRMILQSKMERTDFLIQKRVSRNIQSGSSFFFKSIPEELFYRIRDFLQTSELLSVLNSSENFRTLKKKVVHYKFNEHYSAQYLIDQDFRNRVLERIIDPGLQLHLKVLEFSFLLRCPEEYLPHKISLNIIVRECLSCVLLVRHRQQYLQQIPSLRNFTFSQFLNTANSRHVILFNGQTVSAESTEKGKSKYDVLLQSPDHYYCLEHFSLGYNSVLFDLSSFRYVKKLILQHCSSIEDVSSLSQIDHLELIDCENISDVSALSHVKTLSISGCDRIRDISGLEHNQSLSLEACAAIQSFSCLSQNRSIRNLSLHHPFPINELKLSSTVQTLTLRSYRGREVLVTPSLRQLRLFSSVIHDSLSFRDFAHLHSLELHQCYHLVNLTGLGGIHTIVLDQCPDLLSLQGLSERTYRVEVNGCQNLSDFSALRAIPVVKVQNCRRFKRCEDVFRVEVLTIHDSFSFHCVEGLLEVQTLTLSHCYRFSRLATSSATCDCLSIIDCDEFVPQNNLPELRKWSKILVTVAGHFVQEVLQNYASCLGETHSFDKRGNRGIFLKRI